MIRDFLLLWRYQLMNVLRTKWIVAYGLFFFGFVCALLIFGGDSSKVTASVLSIVLLIVPMISILYGTITWYNSVPFVHLLLAQPLRRSHVFVSSWLAVAVGLAGSFSLSVVSALLFNGALDPASLTVVLFGAILTFIFVGLGHLLAVGINDRMKGVGIAFLLWFYFAILHDALVFAMASGLRDHPIEIPTMILMALNPVDLTRIQVLLTLDLSAMMGYTGKILQHFLSGPWGKVLTTISLFLWIFVPISWALRIFSRKDI
jgi:Cu-processing system permease protein